MIMKKAFISLILVSGSFVAKAQWVVVKRRVPGMIVAAPPVRVRVAVPAARVIIARPPVVVVPPVVVRPSRLLVQSRIVIL